MWVEPDTNIAGGEVLIRQLVHRKDIIKKKCSAWESVVDIVASNTFGYTAALPQILKRLRRKISCDTEDILVL